MMSVLSLVSADVLCFLLDRWAEEEGLQIRQKGRFIFESYISADQAAECQL